MICVIVILGVMATMFAPRIINTQSRSAELEATHAQALCTLTAQKAAMWSLPVAIDFRDGRLTLWSRRSDSLAGSEGAAIWRPDLFAEPVVLTNLKLARATLDGQLLPNQAWRIEFAPGRPRPAITLELEPVTANAGPSWRIIMEADASSAQRFAAAAGSAAPQQTAIRAIDLDDAGKGTAPW